VEVFYDKDIDNNSFNNIRELIDERLEELEERIHSEEKTEVKKKKKGLFK
jgi:hypothetical protein